ncbi:MULTISPECIES: polysaccharide biosynthesis tyrosine autokinase [Serratia]|uniref:Tyrosine-protein kinase wzc n=1 Tax=Serratia ficaria TaxID=61651 RepID=A0A240C685_SERFI|nr:MULTISPECIES: polysaccharide biosynthesis tyrosine autokinase [Serratia]REF44322.1 tyrosine-protein kinase Etk/Wzc [Serratia ficaria]CAI0768590.1 Tyrosine-protein kinase wzc [Serratia ficaria]CAI0780649.1 Tyrosine-protein kinase wzc [Serratia ficaria]CAI0793517.1 Tyrosine-protein kinase wzc [Serratia ficaria]CAI0794245.1 Tyrosine-protein kinase wzc [Serratia ficaria]
MKNNALPIVMAEQDEKLEWERLVGPLWDSRWRIALATGVAGALGAVYALLATPVYQATALVQVEQPAAGASLLQETLATTLGQSASTQDEMVLANSRFVLGKTVDDMNLTVSSRPDSLPLVGKGLARLRGETAPVLSIAAMTVPGEMLGETLRLTLDDKRHFTLSSDGSPVLSGVVGQAAAKGAWSIKVSALDAPAGTRFRVMKVARQQAIDDLRDSLSIAGVGKDSGIMSFRLENEDPQKAEAVLKNIADNYLQQNVDRKTEEAQRTLAFLGEQLPRTQAALNSAENQLNRFRQQNDSVDLSLEAKSVLDTSVQLEAQLNELTFKEAEISKLYTRQHPAYRALLEKRATLEEEKARMGRQVQSLPKTQQEILRLTRDVQVDQQVYMQLMNKQQELSISKAGAVGNVRIIDEAETAIKPVKPQKALIVLLALMLGAVLSASVALLRAVFHRGINDIDTLEKRGINVYATVPLSPWQVKHSRGQQQLLAKSGAERLPILALAEPTDLSVEAIRSLRTSLHFAMLEAKNNILMVSGASPESGKSFTSTNLAVVIAQAGQRVLLIDADMRKGFLHRWLATDARNGLSDMLVGKVTAQDAVRKTATANLDFVSRGRVPPNPSELLMHHRFADFLHWAGQRYDLVLIDTPPVLAVTDAAIVGNHVGTALMVVRFEVNTVKQIETSLRRFEQNGVAVKGVILNGVVKKAATDMSYYNFAYPSHREDLPQAGE